MSNKWEIYVSAVHICPHKVIIQSLIYEKLLGVLTIRRDIENLFLVFVPEEWAEE